MAAIQATGRDAILRGSGGTDSKLFFLTFRFRIFLTLLNCGGYASRVEEGLPHFLT